MTDAEQLPRRYTEKEVGLLLRRATEIQRSEPSARDPAGLTLRELEEVAVEAGIDPACLRHAAAELDAGGGASTLGAKLAGAPLAFLLERTVPGELPDAAFEDLVPLMQSGTLGQGTASAVGKTLTWSSRSDTNTSSQQILVSSRDGRTTIRVEERLSGLAGALHGGLVAGVGGGVGIGLGGTLGGVLGSVALAVAFPVAIIGGSYAGARAIFAAQVRGRRRRMEKLLDRLAERVAAAARVPADIEAAPHRALSETARAGRPEGGSPDPRGGAGP